MFHSLNHCLFYGLLLLVFLLAPHIFSKTICPPGEHWVQAHNRRAYFRADGTFVKASHVTAHCRKNPSGYSFWESKLKTGRPVKWPNKNEKTITWSEEEKERLLEAISDLPPELWSNHVQGIYKMNKSKDENNPASNLPEQDIIVIYDSAFEKDVNLSRVLSHELSHVLYRHLSKEKQKDYQLATNWFSVKKVRGKEVWIRRSNGYVLPDGTVSPEEDFCNNVEFFLFQPETLQKVTPHAYSWILNEYGGKFKVKRKEISNATEK